MSFVALASQPFESERHACRFYLRFPQPVSREEFRHAVWYTMSHHEPFRQWYTTRRREVAQNVLDLFQPGAGDCAICCGEDGGSVQVLKQCGHSFHPACLSKWLVKGSATCPYCRSPINIS